MLEALGGAAGLTLAAQDAVAAAVESPEFASRERGQYACALLNRVMDAAFKAGLDVSDRLAEALVRWTRRASDADAAAAGGVPSGASAGVCRTLSAPEPVGRVTVVSTDDMLAGNTGCFLWPASLALAQRLAAEPSRVRGRACLCLGCGVGLDGIVARRLGAGPVVMVDCSREALGKARESMALSGVAHADLDPGGPGPRDLRAGALDAGTNYLLRAGFEDLDAELPLGAVVLAADVLYGPEMVRLVVPLLERLFRRNRGRGLTAVVAGAVRHEESHALWCRLVRESPAMRAEMEPGSPHDAFPGSDLLFSEAAHGTVTVTLLSEAG